MTTFEQSHKHDWNKYPENMPEKSGQYRVLWSNKNENVLEYSHGFLTIDEQRRFPPENFVSDVHVIAWKNIDYEV